jgi:hypothetical protein
MTPAVTDNRAQERSNSSSEGGIKPSATGSGEDDEVRAEGLRSGSFRLELARLFDQETPSWAQLRSAIALLRRSGTSHSRPTTTLRAAMVCWLRWIRTDTSLAMRSSVSLLDSFGYRISMSTIRFADTGSVLQ